MKKLVLGLGLFVSVASFAQERINPVIPLVSPVISKIINPPFYFYDEDANHWIKDKTNLVYELRTVNYNNIKYYIIIIKRNFYDKNELRSSNSFDNPNCYIFDESEFNQLSKNNIITTKLFIDFKEIHTVNLQYKFSNEIYNLFQRKDYILNDRNSHSYSFKIKKEGNVIRFIGLDYFGFRSAKWNGLRYNLIDLVNQYYELPLIEFNKFIKL